MLKPIRRGLPCCCVPRGEGNVSPPSSGTQEAALLAAMLGSAEAAAAAKGVARRVQAAAVRPHFEEAEAALFAQLSTAKGGAAG